MPRPIEEGDKVRFVYTYPTAETSMFGTILSTPSDTGDMWYVKDEDGEIIAVNPMCCYLKSVTKILGD